MKKIMMAFLLMLSIAGKAQTTDKMDKTISVSSSVKMTKNVKGYRANIMVSLDQLYYTDQNYCTLQELLDRYYSKLEEVGIDTGKLQEEKLRYLSTGYQKDGTFFTFETESKDEISKISGIRVNGVTVNNVEYGLEADEDQLDEIRVIAMEQAKLKAAKLAAVSNGKVGDVVSISEQSSNYIYWTSYYEAEDYFSLSVTFEMK